MVDRYTKAVLTVIALALVAVAIKPVLRPECGRPERPCWIATPPTLPLYVTTGMDTVYVTTKPQDSVAVSTDRDTGPLDVHIVR